MILFKSDYRIIVTNEESGTDYEFPQQFITTHPTFFWAPRSGMFVPVIDHILKPAQKVFDAVDDDVIFVHLSWPPRGRNCFCAYMLGSSISTSSLREIKYDRGHGNECTYSYIDFRIWELVKGLRARTCVTHVGLLDPVEVKKI